MNTQEKFVLAKNTVANLFRGGAAAAVALLLPHFLTRYMSTTEYGTWSLVLQLGTYISYLDFGLQTAVGRYVAHATERQDWLERDQIVSTAFFWLCLSGTSGFLILCGLAAILPTLFVQMPASLVLQARIGLVLIAGSLALSLPFSVFNGVFIGVQRNEVPAAVISATRVLSAIVTVVLARHGWSLAMLAGATAAVNCASYLLQYGLYRRLLPEMRLARRFVVPRAARELFSYCKSLTIWSMCMLVITGVGIVLVGLFRFHDAAYYSVAASLVTFLVGIQNSVFNAMIPAAAMLGARNDAAALGRMVVTATRYGMLLLLVTGVPLILFSHTVLVLWVGPVYAKNAAPILSILLLANIIRLSATPYSVTLIGTAKQRFVIFPPLLEAGINIFVSVIAGYKLGTLGVALGTLVGAIVGVLAHWLYGMPKVQGISFSRFELVKESVLKPLAAVVPALGAYSLYLYAKPSNHAIQALMFLLLVVALAESLRRWGLTSNEKTFFNARRLLVASRRAGFLT